MTTPDELFSCDGRVDEEKMYELLSVGTETDALDYKATLDLGRSAGEKQKIEFIKDCLAMMNLPTGGYLVIGVDGQGAPAGKVAPIDGSHFDSASLTQRVGGYVDCPVDIVAAVHRHSDGRDVAVVYVRPVKSGLPAITNRAGTYRAESGSTVPVFREGEIFVREGSVNARLSHRLWPLVLDRYRASIRAETRADTDHLIGLVVAATRKNNGGNQGITPSLEMDGPSFEDAVLSAFESGSTIRLRQFLRDAQNVVQRTYRDPDGAGRQGALNRLTEFTALAIAHERDDDAELGFKALHASYKFPLDHSGIRSTSVGTHQTQTAMYWLDILVHVYALGALAVRYRRWPVVRALALRIIGDATYSYRSWIRHGLVEASRAEILTPKDSSEANGGVVISSSLNLSMALDALHPDIPLTEETTEMAPGSSADRLLSSICQFDLIYCLVAATATGGRGLEFYPSSAAFHQYRVDPALEVIAGDEAIRAVLFPEMPDSTTATAIATVLEAAKHESWRYGGFWKGVRGTAYEHFVEVNAEATEKI